MLICYSNILRWKRNFKFRGISLPIQVKEILHMWVYNNLYPHLDPQPGFTENSQSVKVYT